MKVLYYTFELQKSNVVESSGVPSPVADVELSVTRHLCYTTVTGDVVVCADATRYFNFNLDQAIDVTIHLQTPTLLVNSESANATRHNIYTAPPVNANRNLSYTIVS
jgi:hypothetical protein